MSYVSAAERERAKEQDYVDRVYTQLRHASRSARSIEAESRARFTSNRETWVREEDGTALFERDAFAFQAARRLASLDAEHEGLVFGRLDFAPPPANPATPAPAEPEPAGGRGSTGGQRKPVARTPRGDAGSRTRAPEYIGRIGVRTDDFEPLVIDWRAPAAEPFYRATGSQPMGVVRRRVLQCHFDRVVGIDDDAIQPDLVDPSMTIIGDGALLTALGRARERHMHDIVETIQAEQDEAIRAPYAGFTTIVGGPGTGKTVVGLHRVAYLLYSNRRRFSNGGVLVVGPSGVFLNYIERVLPSLGEDSVTLRCLGDVIGDVAPITATRTDTAAAIAVKGRSAMASLLRRLVELPLIPPERRTLLVTVKGEPIRLTAGRLAAIRREALRDTPYHGARAAAARAVADALWQDRPETVEVDDPAEFKTLVTSSSAYTRFLDAWWPVLTAEQVLARLADVAVVREVAGAVQGRAAGRSRPRALLNDAAAATLATSIRPGDWSTDDIPLLDELLALLGPAFAGDEPDEPNLFLDTPAVGELITIADQLTDRRDADDTEEVHSTYAHILVDEAQDLTPMQWRMLGRRGPQASWTIVGDPAQSRWGDPTDTARTLAALRGSAPHREFHLTKNYRSPAEVFDLAAAVIVRAFPDADLPEAVRRTGVEPRLDVCDSAKLPARVAATVDGLAAEVTGTIGVVVPDAHRNMVVAALVAADPDRVVVLDPLTVKGLEYDAVVVVDPDEIVASTPGGVRTLYVALTRPTQILVTLDLDAEGAWRP